jgi:hypothetical protein
MVGVGAGLGAAGLGVAAFAGFDDALLDFGFVSGALFRFFWMPLEGEAGFALLLGAAFTSTLFFLGEDLGRLYRLTDRCNCCHRCFLDDIFCELPSFLPAFVFAAVATQEHGWWRPTISSRQRSR